MIESLVSHAVAVRIGLFVGVFATMAVWEVVSARRALRTSKRARWVANLLIIATGSVLVRLVFPLGAIGVAWGVAELGWGVFNLVQIPEWAAILGAFIALDLVIWVQHVMFHAVPALWKVHMMHHADLDFDVTTGLRFHPVELLISMGIKAAAIVVLGPPVVAVLIFEVLLNATSLFNHANVRLPGGLDRVLRWLVVTPDMHRVHHSVAPSETNTNFGFNLPWWDRIFGTYRAQPAAGHEAMEIGLEQLRDPKKNTFLHLLALPFVAAAGDYDIRHREIEPPP